MALVLHDGLKKGLEEGDLKKKGLSYKRMKEKKEEFLSEFKEISKKMDESIKNFDLLKPKIEEKKKKYDEIYDESMKNILELYDLVISEAMI